MERCRSPLEPGCKGTDIAVYIFWGGKTLPICQRCWSVIADSDLEWGEGVPKSKLKEGVEATLKEMIQRAIHEAVEREAERAVKSAVRMLRRRSV